MRMDRYRVRKVLRVTGKYVAAVVVLVVMFFPIYNLLRTSVQFEVDIRARDVSLIPKYITWVHYQEVLWPGHIVPIREAIRNSFILSTASSLLCMVLASMAAYALVRLQFKGKHLFLFGLSSIYLFPGILFVIPLFIFVVKLGLTDTFISLIIPYSAFILPFMIWVLRSFFLKIPADLEAAALIDGCNIRQLIFRVVLPLSIPGLIATFIFGFILSWIEFLTPLVFTTARFPILMVSLGLYRGTVDIKIGQQAAAAVVAMLPVALLTILFQRFIISGLLAGSEKG